MENETIDPITGLELYRAIQLQKALEDAVKFHDSELYDAIWAEFEDEE